MGRLFSILIIGILLTSCQYDPYAHNYTTVEPTAKDVIGTYEFHMQTVDRRVDNNKFKNDRPLMVIKADKTYKIVGLPTFKEIGPLDYKLSGRVFVTGKWTIGTVGSISSGNGDYSKHWGLYLESAPAELHNAGLLGREKPNGMIFGFGDPDSGDVMVLNKK